EVRGDGEEVPQGLEGRRHREGAARGPQLAWQDDEGPLDSACQGEDREDDARIQGRRSTQRLEEGSEGHQPQADDRDRALAGAQGEVAMPKNMYVGLGYDPDAKAPDPTDLAPSGATTAFETPEQEDAIKKKAAEGRVINMDDLGYMGHFATDKVTRQGHN